MRAYSARVPRVSSRQGVAIVQWMGLYRMQARGAAAYGSISGRADFAVRFGPCAVADVRSWHGSWYAPEQRRAAARP